ncbi:MAG: hypothetical protein RMK62_12315 [Armatimonadota bacterium]|nr:hypothetical protein [Armatimonadota bacterium]
MCFSCWIPQPIFLLSANLDLTRSQSDHSGMGTKAFIPPLAGWVLCGSDDKGDGNGVGVLDVFGVAVVKNRAGFTGSSKAYKGC